MTKAPAEVARLFGARRGAGANFAAEVYPGYPGLVVAEGETRVMTWGFPLALKGRNGQPLRPKPVNNAREDKLGTSFWRASFERRRCLIPVTALAEAEGLKGQMTRTWYSMAGREVRSDVRLRGGGLRRSDLTQAKGAKPMGDRAPVHITIGGALPREHLETFAAHAADYDLRTEWDGEPFDPAALPGGEPLELYGTELNGGQIPEIDAFCAEHGLPYRRWSGGCLGAFLPEIVLFDGRGPMRDYTASEDEYVLFPPSWINSFTRLRDLKREMARAELTIPAFEVTGGASDDRS